MTPLTLDGEMIEPRVSVPMAKPTSPAAVAEPGPAEDPLDAAALAGPRDSWSVRGTSCRPARARPSTASPAAWRPRRAAARRPWRRSRGPAPGTARRPRSWECPWWRTGPWRPTGCRAADPCSVPARISRSACAACSSARSSVSVTTQFSFGPIPLQAREIHLREVGRRHVTPLDHRRQRGDGQERQIVEGGASRGWNRGGRHLDFRARCSARLRLLPREIRPERHGRLGVERDVHLAQLLERVEIAAHAAGHLLVLGLG